MKYFYKKIHRLSKIRSRQGLYEFLETNYSKINAGSKVLSVGSGGEVNEKLKDAVESIGFSMVTIDIDSNRQPDIVGDICSFEFKENEFDVIVLSEVLEHLYNPQAGIDNLYRALKSNGKLLLTTPFIFPLHDRPYDYYRFTKYGLEYLLKEFSKIEIKDRNSSFEAIDVLWMRTLQINSSRAYYLSFFILPLVFYIQRPITKLLSRILPNDSMTTGYVVLCEK